MVRKSHQFLQLKGRRTRKLSSSLFLSVTEKAEHQADDAYKKTFLFELCYLAWYDSLQHIERGF